MYQDDPIPPGESRKQQDSRRKKNIARLVGVLLAAFLAFVVGFIGGSGFGGNYAADFSFLGMPGYEGSSLLGGLAAGLAVLVIGGVTCALSSRGGGLLLVLVGALAAIALGPRLLFPVIPPEESAFALIYLGCAVVGGAIGWGVSLLGPK